MKEMDTFDLVSLFLKEKIGERKSLRVTEYDLDGSRLKITFSYNPDYEFDRQYTFYEWQDFNLLDYFTFIFNLKHEIK